MKKQHYIVAILFVVALFVGYSVGVYAPRAHDSRSDRRIATHVDGSLTSPLLECTEGEESLSIGDRVSLERQVVSYVDTAVSQNKVSEVAIYFRDLNNGPWFGINERMPFTPGSLLKLPLAMSLYHVQMENPDTVLLTQEIEYSGGPPRAAVESEFGSDTPLALGVYTVGDLIGIMLKESNNDAALVLAQYAGTDVIQSVYTDLGIEKPELGADYETSVKLYGAFFRVLYNASYAGTEGSEKLLSMLTQSSFRDGLVAGVPAGIQIAHKFGTRSTEFPDCGIVYTQKTPYILCIMTRGDDFEKLVQFIAEVSRLVYTEVAGEQVP